MSFIKCRLCKKRLYLKKDWHVEIKVKNPPSIQGGSPPPKPNSIIAQWHWQCFMKEINK